MTNRPSILVVDDDIRLLAALTIFLRERGYKVTSAGDGREGWECFARLRPDLAVLDVMMPEIDGWELCTRIREMADTPVIMLTARGQEVDRVKGLKMGADDYLVKPFSLNELEARIEAVLRRTRRGDEPGKGGYRDATLTVDPGILLVEREGTPVALSPTERRLLFFLVENMDRVMPTARILEAVWGPEYLDETTYVKLYIRRLRQKIEPDPAHPRYLITERGVGYRFAGKAKP